MRVVLAFTLAALFLASSARAEESSADPELEAVMRGLAESRGWRAVFVERRRIPLLAEPIEARGRLAVVRPGAFSRVTETPRWTRLVLEDGALRLDAAPGVEPPAVAPGLHRMAEEFLLLLGGDLDALRERYELSFRVAAAGWSLDMVPRSREARRYVSRLVLRGSAMGIVSLELEEAGGGGAITRFSELEADRPLDSEERAYFFGAAPTP